MPPRSTAPGKTARKKAAAHTAAALPVKLLSGGNPQIAKGHGDGPVQNYINAMPAWKQAVGRRLDQLIMKAEPKVKKAVKWNTPFYGLDGETWFLGFHCLTKYVKVAFMMGAHMDPQPPGTSKQKNVRYLDIYEDEPFDEKQFIIWVKQAAKLPAEKL